MELSGESGLYCPGSLTKPEFQPPEGFNVPTYVAGNLKVPPSLPRYLTTRSFRPPRKQLAIRPVQMPTCYDNFAIAKKFHTENLQHQPLPDRVDDRIFSSVRFPRAKSCGSLQSAKSLKKYQELTPKIFQRPLRNQSQCGYSPVLGCKKPETRMDLAICWDAPIDPSYEPRRPVHIDGTDGGPAPAVFTLVQHPSDPIESSQYLPSYAHERSPSVDAGALGYLGMRRDSEERSKTELPQVGFEARTPYIDSPVADDPVSRNSLNLSTRYKTEEQEQQDEIQARKQLDDVNKCLCNGFENIHVSEVERALAKRHTSSPEVSNRPDKIPTYLRSCKACDKRPTYEQRKKRGNQQRFAHSAGSKCDEDRRNGLPTSLHIPRPRTPFARRTFCIDTLSPPFSVVKGCRDADYPEHWRLTSVYQQSYKPPRIHRPNVIARPKR